MTLASGVTACTLTVAAYGNVRLKLDDQSGDLGTVTATLNYAAKTLSSGWTSWSGVSGGTHVVTLNDSMGELEYLHMDLTGSPTGNFSVLPGNKASDNSSFNFTVTAFDVDITITVS